MNIQRSVFDDESGVSPVIGVILMVAVTVIIAAVIGSTALGLGDSVSETPPQAQIEAETLEDHVPESDKAGDDAEITAVELEHTGGEDINYDDINVEVNGKQAYSSDPDADFPHNNNDWTGPVYPWQGTDTISAGDTAIIVMGTDSLEENDIPVDPINEHRVLFNWGGETSEPVGATYWDGDWKPDTQDELLEEGDEVRIIWESGDQSQTLLEEEIK